MAEALTAGKGSEAAAVMDSDAAAVSPPPPLPPDYSPRKMKSAVLDDLVAEAEAEIEAAAEAVATTTEDAATADPPPASSRSASRAQPAEYGVRLAGSPGAWRAQVVLISSEDVMPVRAVATISIAPGAKARVSLTPTLVVRADDEDT